MAARPDRRGAAAADGESECDRPVRQEQAQAIPSLAYLAVASEPTGGSAALTPGRGHVRTGRWRLR